jgi:hypothetical protein
MRAEHNEYKILVGARITVTKSALGFADAAIALPAHLITLDSLPSFP